LFTSLEQFKRPEADQRDAPKAATAPAIALRRIRPPTYAARKR
jgi:hypothetical protein